jgi:hypothetical protein
MSNREGATIQLKVNGAERSFDGDPEMPLLWYLRDVLALTGSKFGCGIGLCGAWTVHVKQDNAEHHVILAFTVLLLFFLGALRFLSPPLCEQAPFQTARPAARRFAQNASCVTVKTEVVLRLEKP